MFSDVYLKFNLHLHHRGFGVLGFWGSLVFLSTTAFSGMRYTPNTRLITDNLGR